MSRHNGRAGKHGVYNSKHNDRSFDVANAENIDAVRTNNNLYWDWQNGLRTHAENELGQFPTFAQSEHDFYAQQYGAYLKGQAERNRKSGHSNRDRTVDDLLQDARVCPEETIYQIGKDGDCPPPEVLQEIVEEFMETFTDRFGAHVHILDWALHLDETSPHIHARQVFDIVNRYGEIEPKQEKALELLGIPLAEPDKKPSRYNNRKIVFDGMCRNLLLDICRNHGLEVETEAIYGGRRTKEKNDYIIASQQEKLADLEKRNAELEAENKRQAQLLEQREAELDDKLAKLADADSVLEAVSDAAYDEAVKLVAQTAVEETQKADTKIVDKLIDSTNDQEKKMKAKERDLVAYWLGGVKNMITNRAASIIKSVLELLQKPEHRRAAKAKIVERAKPAVRELLAQFAHRQPRTDDLQKKTKEQKRAWEIR